jgi:hypothetical protein
MRAQLFAAMLTVALAPVLTATPPPPKAPPLKAKAAPARMLRIPVAGEVAAGLRPSDLEVKVAGSGEARVLRVKTSKDELMLLLVFDLVKDLASIDLARNALVAAIGALPENIYVGVLRAQDGLQVVLDPTTDRQSIAQAIQGLQTTGAAGLLTSAETAALLADSVAAKATVRVAVLYITDTGVQDYREDFTNPVINSSDARDLSRRFPEGLIREKIAKVSEALARYQTPVSIVHLHYANDRLNEAYQSGLLRLATSTGGEAAFSRSAVDIPDTVVGALNAARNQYRIWVQLPAKVPKTVQVTVSHKGRSLAHRSRFVLP